MTAGRFDVNDPAYSEDRTVEAIKAMLELANNEGTHLVLTLAPYGTSPEKNQLLTSLNDRLKKEFEDATATILDLNNTIAPQGTLLTGYSSDGLHLNAAAYNVWASMVIGTMAGGDSFRPTAPTKKR